MNNSRTTTPMRVVLLLAVLFITVAGCAKGASFRLDKNYSMVRPASIAVLPTITLHEAPDISFAEDFDDFKDEAQAAILIRKILEDKLKLKGYAVLAPLEVDKIYNRAMAKGYDESRKMGREELASLFGTQAVIFSEITHWDSTRMANYASLKVGAHLELYLSDGTMLWNADQNTREADVRLDKPSLEFAIIKAYEPRIERIIDAILATLPARPVTDKERVLQGTEEKEGYFDWLP
jgi:hypothetical protein